MKLKYLAFMSLLSAGNIANAASFDFSELGEQNHGYAIPPTTLVSDGFSLELEDGLRYGSNSTQEAMGGIFVYTSSGKLELSASELEHSSYKLSLTLYSSTTNNHRFPFFTVASGDDSVWYHHNLKADRLNGVGPETFEIELTAAQLEQGVSLEGDYYAIGSVNIEENKCASGVEKHNILVDILHDQGTLSTEDRDMAYDNSCQFNAPNEPLMEYKYLTSAGSANDPDLYRIYQRGQSDGTYEHQVTFPNSQIDAKEPLLAMINEAEEDAQLSIRSAINGGGSSWDSSLTIVPGSADIIGEHLFFRTIEARGDRDYDHSTRLRGVWVQADE